MSSILVTLKILLAEMADARSRVQRSSRWCGLVVRRGGTRAQVSSSLEQGSKLCHQKQSSSRQCDVNHFGMNVPNVSQHKTPPEAE
ncbi:hypothetical protein TNCV_748431 [Trichonephila clavipes]|nr:hypothetical protein TNCV_748431 [Trichonephila clavipes]